MGTRTSAFVFVAMLATVGCVASESGAGGGSAGGKADDLGGCELSELGLHIYEAAADADPTQSAVPASRILTYDNEVGQALLDGGEIFPALGDVIAGAQHSVSIAMFVWEVDSDAHREIERGLVELAQNVAGGSDRIDPVRVRILVNAITPTGQPRRFGESISRAVMALNLDPGIIRVDVATRNHTGFGAMHLKLAIVDDFAVHLGGANVEAVHDWTDTALPWRDSAYTVYGEIARSMAIEFAALWDTANEWVCSDIDCHQFPAFPVTPSGVSPERADDCTPMIALNRWPIGGVNNLTDSAQDAGVLAGFANATDIIKIHTPNLNDDAVRDAIYGAIERGVRVQVLTSRGFNDAASGFIGQGGTNVENADRLYAEAAERFGQGAACDHLDFRWYTRGGTVVDGNVAGASHLKYTSFDNQVVVVGSMNMDTQSWNHSGEANIAIDDAGTTRRFDGKIFDGSFAQAQPSGHCL